MTNEAKKRRHEPVGITDDAKAAYTDGLRRCLRSGTTADRLGVLTHTFVKNDFLLMPLISPLSNEFPSDSRQTSLFQNRKHIPASSITGSV